MTTWLSFGLLLLTATLAMRKTSGALKLYFRAQLIATLALFAAVKMFGVNDDFYRALYIIVTIPILEVCVFLIWESRDRWKHLSTSLSFAMLSTTIAVAGMDKFTVDVWISLIEGALLSAIGMGLLLAAQNSDERETLSAIGMLSLALSVFDFGYVSNANWQDLNKWLPSLLCAASWGWILLQRKRVTA